LWKNFKALSKSSQNDGELELRGKNIVKKCGLTLGLETAGG
jgi:hypothetical protein